MRRLDRERPVEGMWHPPLSLIGLRVMLEPPDDSTELRQLLGSFGITFPAMVDGGDHWLALLRDAGLSSPLLVVSRRGEFVAAGKLELVLLVRRLVGGGTIVE
jgi:hypothetical protein